MRKLLPSLFVVGCTPTPPFHTLETAETLKAREVSVSVGGGAGGDSSGGFCCGGGVARVRYGLGGQREVGIDASFIDDGTNADFGGKLAYKRGLTPNFAFVAGAGVTYGHNRAYGTSAGGDVAAVASTDGAGAQLYGSLRLGAGVPVRSDLYSEGGIVEAATLAAGVMLPLAPRLRLLGEAGGIGTLAERYRSFDPSTPRGTFREEGFYVAAAVTYVWSR
jgi:hypothetical protein